jgi:hypothetical protein
VETALVATWPGQGLLPSLREALADADSALLCVAFANQKGVNLLEPQLGVLGRRCRLLVTSSFGGETTATALASAASMHLDVRVLNPSSGTFHPKLYLARKGTASVAVVGSANLTGGLVSNIEAAAVLKGALNDPAIADAWALGERLWEHPANVDWSAGRLSLPPEELAPELLGALRQAVPDGSVLATLANGRPNLVTAVVPQGVYVETTSSRAKGLPAQLVPAWMLQLAWDYLCMHGALTNRYLLAADGLNVKRSSAVCTILAQLPDVEVASTRPIALTRVA